MSPSRLLHFRLLCVRTQSRACRSRPHRRIGAHTVALAATLTLHAVARPRDAWPMQAFRSRLAKPLRLLAGGQGFEP
jgi:hypothetical protein